MCFGSTKSVNVFFTIDLDIEPIRKMQSLFHKEKNFVPSFEIFSICINKVHPAYQEFVSFLINLANDRFIGEEVIKQFETDGLSPKGLEFKSNRLDLNFKEKSFNVLIVEGFRNHLLMRLSQEFRFKNLMLNHFTNSGQIRYYNGKKYQCQNLQGWPGTPLYGFSPRDPCFSIPIGWNDSIRDSLSEEFETIRSENLTELLSDIYEKNCGKLPFRILLAGKKIEMTIHAENITKVEIGRI